MNERRSSRIRAWIAGGIFVALLVAAFLINRSQEPQPVESAEPAPSTKPAPVPPIRPAPLTRVGLIEAAARAADAFASGRPTSPEDQQLVGRRFTLVLPFGCDRPAREDSEASASWSYDIEEETLRASVTPQDWTGVGEIRIVTGDMPFEAAEGFWITRPWIRSAVCPSQPAAARPGRDDAEVGNGDAAVRSSGAREEGEGPAAADGAPVQETLGIVEFFEAGSRRAARRNGRPYRLTARLAEGEIDLDQGLRLVIEGRLAGFPSGQPVACWSNGPEHPPTCLISVRTARVAVTDASGERLLAEWTA